MKDIYKIRTRGCALTENIVSGDKYRITVLTDGLIRLEYSEKGDFEDRATQCALYRDFPKVKYRIIETDDGIEIHTARIHLMYNKKEFSPYGLSIQVKGNLSAYHSIWRYGEDGCPSFLPQLKGTARTLDMADGEIPLEPGIISATGYSVLDDSHSQIILDNGWIEPRGKGVKDIYFFGYGHDYKEALKDFYYLSGKMPMLPRYALGNWWSRYYKYTEDSYMELMDCFEQENLPFTVAVIDMDWHLVDINPKYGSGWTGYTWNKELFPDPKRFLENLHQRGMYITLNVHPADGVRAHEEMYEKMAKALGVDYENEDPIVCDITEPTFIEAYFKYLHHPREDEGVDFWWIDWQQGTKSKVEGLDPLWVLNHFHFLDSKRNGKRPITFSRYAGPGSHRYPIGFSGDTWATWKSLEFQPYFTASATNIGYGWWSHDIGGHMGGCKDDEMIVRWTQSGLYSPILRLHSSNNTFNGKEPWRLKLEAQNAMGNALRDRHRMLPYLYTMNYRAYNEDLPLITPMYYEYPESGEAYERKNQFMFGSELMVAPITKKMIRELHVAEVAVWIPEGIWYDIYTGMIYEGNREMVMYRDLNSIPVLAKAGAIIPFTDEIQSRQAINNPKQLRVKVFPGANGYFEMYEDDNVTCAYEKGDCVKTTFSYLQDEKLKFVINESQGNLALIPESRNYIVEFYGLKKPLYDQLTIKVDGNQYETVINYDEKRQLLSLEISEIYTSQNVVIELSKELIVNNNRIIDHCFCFLNQAEIDYDIKEKTFGLIKNENRIPVILAQLQKMRIDEALLGVLTELLTAKISV